MPYITLCTLCTFLLRTSHGIRIYFHQMRFHSQVTDNKQLSQGANKGYGVLNWWQKLHSRIIKVLISMLLCQGYEREYKVLCGGGAPPPFLHFIHYNQHLDSLQGQSWWTVAMLWDLNGLLFPRVLEFKLNRSCTSQPFPSILTYFPLPRPTGEEKKGFFRFGKGLRNFLGFLRPIQ